MQDKLRNTTVTVDDRRATRLVGSRVNGAPSTSRAPKSEIHVNKQGDRIESIVVTCACGEQVTLFCDYSESKS